jgi:Sulfotransferase domain
VTLKIVGAGWGRTGTHSLKLALEQLGFGPCYHMLEVFPRPQHVAVWHSAALGERVDWKALFMGFQSAVDWPAAHFWRQIGTAFPDAKVVLTSRPSEAWYKSFHDTILEYALDMPTLPESEPRHAWQKMVQLIISEQTFDNRLRDKQAVIGAYEAHNAEVRRSIPKARLLDFESTQGWEPLCGFLNVPVPATPFPKTNSTQEFRDRAQMMRAH